MKEVLFALSQVLKHEPDVVIIDDDDLPDDFQDFMKPLITNTKISIDCQGEKPKYVKAPHFIICTGAIDPLELKVSKRRFTVVSL